jgi:two-component sensor histidine kinase
MLNFQKLEDAQTLAQAIVNTIPEPFIVLDDKLRVLAASASFYQIFKVESEQTRGRLLYSLGDGQWDIPALRLLLETIIPEQAAMDGFEVEHDFPNLGRRTMLLNARQVIYEDKSNRTILLAFMDVTNRRAIEREKENFLKQTEDLLRQKDVLLREMEHRVANSLQIIASILLHASEGIDQIDVGTYLTTLCGSLAASMVGESHPIAVKVMADTGAIGSDRAVSLGLIVTELVINAVKYAFPDARADAVILVTYEIDGADWKLTVSDNGIGKTADAANITGLGTAITQALVKQLGAVMEVASGADGMTISITRATFTSHMPRAS